MTKFTPPAADAGADALTKPKTGEIRASISLDPANMTGTAGDNAIPGRGGSTLPYLTMKAALAHDAGSVTYAVAKPNAVKRKYDLKAMRYSPDSSHPRVQFVWSLSPQGHDFWAKHYFEQESDESHAALAEMAAQFEQENSK
jgi:hypothetical protein